MTLLLVRPASLNLGAVSTLYQFRHARKFVLEAFEGDAPLWIGDVDFFVKAIHVFLRLISSYFDLSWLQCTPGDILLDFFLDRLRLHSALLRVQE